MRATWYVLEDGTAVDPAECSINADGYGVTHESGALVAMMAPDCPKTTGVDLDESMTPEPPATAPKRGGYKTRGGK